MEVNDGKAVTSPKADEPMMKPADPKPAVDEQSEPMDTDSDSPANVLPSGSATSELSLPASATPAVATPVAVAPAVATPGVAPSATSPPEVRGFTQADVDAHVVAAVSAALRLSEEARQRDSAAAAIDISSSPPPSPAPSDPATASPQAPATSPPSTGSQSGQENLTQAADVEMSSSLALFLPPASCDDASVSTDDTPAASAADCGAVHNDQPAAHVHDADIAVVGKSKGGKKKVSVNEEPTGSVLSALDAPLAPRATRSKAVGK